MTLETTLKIDRRMMEIDRLRSKIAAKELEVAQLRDHLGRLEASIKPVIYLDPSAPTAVFRKLCSAYPHIDFQLPAPGHPLFERWSDLPKLSVLIPVGGDG